MNFALFSALLQFLHYFYVISRLLLIIFTYICSFVLFLSNFAIVTPVERYFLNFAPFFNNVTLFALFLYNFANLHYIFSKTIFFPSFSPILRNFTNFAIFFNSLAVFPPCLYKITKTDPFVAFLFLLHLLSSRFMIFLFSFSFFLYCFFT